jgi:hypothetical protein
MKFKITEVIPAASQRYPYTHRLEVYADALAADKVSAWLQENDAQYVPMGWGVYYLRKKDLTMFLLKWS